MYVKTNCILCGNKGFVQAGSWLSESWNVHLAVCEECGLVCQNPRPDEEEMGKFYRDEYSATGEQMIDEHADGKYNWLCSNFGLESLRKGRFLEIGSWAGILLDRLRSEGVEAYGLEPSKKAAKWQREQFGLEVENAFVEESRYQPGFFQHIAAFQMLEHVFDPVSALRKIRTMLADDGRVVIETPNLLYCNCVFPPKSFLPCPRHIFIFSPTSLSRAFAAAGLRVLGVEYQPYWLKVWGEPDGKDVSSQQKPAPEDPREVLKRLRMYSALRNFYYRPKLALRSLLCGLLGKKKVISMLKKLRKTTRH